MSDHHLSRCKLCGHEFEDVEKYIRHLEMKHPEGEEQQDEEKSKPKIRHDKK